MKNVRPKEINLDKYGGCLSSLCPFRSECSQHHTAGDFRSEGGFRPKLRKCDNKILCFSQNAYEIKNLFNEGGSECDAPIEPPIENTDGTGFIKLEDIKTIKSHE